ncbi:signal peptidase I [Streptosporangium sp. NPDC051023]|uniref:signal peptidase I n=1 Tax=Streptosporangium sp. NPDC051023 TaxID=3155410 RepID=UPI00344BAA70
MTSESQEHDGASVPVEDEVGVVAEETQKAVKGKKKGSFWKELPVLIVIALAFALVIKTFVVQAFYIPSESMENTLLVNDQILVNKLVYRVRDIERGDVVVFSGVDSWDEKVQVEEPSNPVAGFFHWVGTMFGVVPSERDYVKRVIGVPGDTVKCCDAQGRVTVNGVPLDEKGYLYPGDVPSYKFFETKVPPGRLWVMGDHRSVSYDSRLHMNNPGGGSIPIDKVIGRAFVVMWPFSRAAVIPIPDTFGQPALKAASAVGGAAPLVAGFAGAVPVVLWRRRRLSRHTVAARPVP